MTTEERQAKKREKKREWTQRWRKANPEKALMETRRWRANNLEKAREHNRRWRKENHKKVLIAHRIYYAKNRENILASQFRAYRADPEKSREKSRRWAKENPEKISAKHFLSRYGITTDALNALWESQKGNCWLCGDSMPSKKESHVDHDHSTNEVRGWAHKNCNLGIGLFDDSPEKMERVAANLRRRGVGQNERRNAA